jgi:hypothetical protein
VALRCAWAGEFRDRSFSSKWGCRGGADSDILSASPLAFTRSPSQVTRVEFPPTNPTSRVQFERPRLERRQGNHRSPAAGRRHTRTGAGIEAVAVHGRGQQRGQWRPARGLAGCTVGNDHQTHRTSIGEASTEAGFAVPIETVIRGRRGAASKRRVRGRAGRRVSRKDDLGPAPNPVSRTP